MQRIIPFGTFFFGVERRRAGFCSFRFLAARVLRLRRQFQPRFDASGSLSAIPASFGSFCLSLSTGSNKSPIFCTRSSTWLGFEYQQVRIFLL